MRKIPYTYSIVKYLHDPAAGEMLNVGVLLMLEASRREPRGNSVKQ